MCGISRKNIWLLLWPLTFLPSAAQWQLQDEAVRALWHGRWDDGAEGGLPQPHGPFPHVQLQLLQRDGRLLAHIWAAQLQGTSLLPEARPVQELQRLERQQLQGGLHQATHGSLKTEEQFFWHVFSLPCFTHWIKWLQCSGVFSFVLALCVLRACFPMRMWRGHGLTSWLSSEAWIKYCKRWQLPHRDSSVIYHRAACGPLTHCTFHWHICCKWCSSKSKINEKTTLFRQSHHKVHLVAFDHLTWSSSADRVCPLVMEFPRSRVKKSLKCSEKMTWH